MDTAPHIIIQNNSGINQLNLTPLLLSKIPNYAKDAPLCTQRPLKGEQSFLSYKFPFILTASILLCTRKVCIWFNKRSVPEFYPSSWHVPEGAKVQVTLMMYCLFCLIKVTVYKKGNFIIFAKIFLYVSISIFITCLR